MKEYILHRTDQTNQGRDIAPPFVQRAMGWAKATNEITGLIRGLLADGMVTEGEAKYLREWIAARPDIMSDPLVNSLALRIERIFADGIVTAEELEELRVALTEYAPTAQTAPTTLPLDNPPPTVIIANRAFCFTGVFLSGTRN
jgi:hypothetical protein